MTYAGCIFYKSVRYCPRGFEWDCINANWYGFGRMRQVSGNVRDILRIRGSYYLRLLENIRRGLYKATTAETNSNKKTSTTIANH